MCLVPPHAHTPAVTEGSETAPGAGGERLSLPERRGQSRAALVGPLKSLYTWRINILCSKCVTCAEKRQPGDGGALRALQRVVVRARALRAGGPSPSVLDHSGVLRGSDPKMLRLQSPVFTQVCVYPPTLASGLGPVGKRAPVSPVPPAQR